MKKYILIKWRDCIDFINAELDKNPEPNEIDKVTVYYPAIDRTVICKTTSLRRVNKYNLQQVTIKCLVERNKHLVNDRNNIDAFGHPDKWYWGTWIITVAADLNSAKAKWEDNRPEYNGMAPHCTVLSQELFENSGLESVFRIKREQTEFRQRLLRLDRCCAITGEKTRVPIEAAHIIDKSQNGAESISNGILLRADIHRLYDAHLFEISEKDGTVQIRGSLSEEYQGILDNKKLQPEIFSRVTDALIERARLQQGG